MKILVFKDGQQHGPFTEMEVLERIEQGTFDMFEDYGWCQGMSEWKPIDEVLNIISEAEIAAADNDCDFSSEALASHVADLAKREEIRVESVEPAVASASSQNINPEDHVIEVIGSAICLIYQTYFRLLGEVVRQLVRELDNQKRPSLKRNRVTESITRLYSVFFGLTEWLKSDGMDSLAKTLSEETLRDDVRDTPCALIASDLRKNGLESFIHLRDDLQNAMNALGIEHESISVVQSAATGAAAGVAINYLATKGKSDGKAAIAGAAVGAGLSLSQKQKLRSEMYTHGLGSCMELLKGLHKLTSTLFDQSILLCLPKRPVKNPKYVALIKQLDEELKGKLTNEGIFVLGFFGILLGKLEAQVELNTARGGLVIMLALILALGTMVSIAGDSSAIWYFLFVIFILPIISSCRKIVRSHKNSQGIDEVMKQFHNYMETNPYLSKS